MAALPNYHGMPLDRDGYAVFQVGSFVMHISVGPSREKVRMDTAPSFRVKAPKALSGPIPAEVIRRLIENTVVVRCGRFLCWEWKGAKHHKDGYGQIRFGQVVHQVHRVSYAAFVGDIPEGITLNHRCLNKICINPEHLEQMRHGDNLAEANRRNGFRGNQYRETGGVPF